MQALIEYIEAECSAIDQEQEYDDLLDECYNLQSVGGPFAHMSASRVLKEVDPVAYRCGKNDYFGCNEDVYEVGGEYYRKDSVEKAREAFIDDLQSELSDLEDRLEDIPEDERHGEPGRVLSSQITEKQAQIAEAEKYAF